MNDFTIIHGNNHYDKKMSYFSIDEPALYKSLLQQNSYRRKFRKRTLSVIEYPCFNDQKQPSSTIELPKLKQLTPLKFRAKPEQEKNETILKNKISLEQIRKRNQQIERFQPIKYEILIARLREELNQYHGKWR